MKYKYLLIGEMGEVTGTNDEVAAKEAADWGPVVNVVEGTVSTYAHPAGEETGSITWAAVEEYKVEELPLDDEEDDSQVNQADTDSGGV